MIYTANFWNKDNHKGKVVSIANSMPPQFKDMEKFDLLVPPWTIVEQLKKGSISWSTYETCYLAHISRYERSIKEFVENHEDITLCCWEKSPERCHRRLAAKYINKITNEKTAVK